MLSDACMKAEKEESLVPPFVHTVFDTMAEGILRSWVFLDR